MRTNVNLWWILTAFSLFIAAVYVVVCDVVDDDTAPSDAVFLGSAARWFTEDVETA